MARMLGRASVAACPVCRRAPGPDCAGKARTKRASRRQEDRQWRRELVDDAT